MIDKIKDAVLKGEGEDAVRFTAEALVTGLEPSTILDKALTAAMAIVGEEYERGDRYVPEMLMSANAMKQALDELRPELVEAGIEPAGRIVIGTVEGDLHDIGKDLVGMMLEGAGFEVIDLGTNVDADSFVCAVQAHHPGVLGMSALLTTTMQRMPEVIAALDESELRATVKVMIGGAPVTNEFASTIGADGYARDAAAAVKLAKSLI